MTLKNNRASLLKDIKLCASFHHHIWIQIGVTVRKSSRWFMTSVTLTFDLWPWPFVWTSLLSLVIAPENFVIIPWWEHSQKGVTDKQADGRTDGQADIHRAAWPQLKMNRVAWNTTIRTQLNGQSITHRQNWYHNFSHLTGVANDQITLTLNKPYYNPVHTSLCLICGTVLYRQCAADQFT